MRIGVKGFQGARLTQARAARGMTQTALAKASGISSPSISKWERGEQMPEFAALERVAEALSLPTTWFLQPLPDYGSGTYFFRSNSSLAAAGRAVARTRLEWLHELSLCIQEWIDWPQLTLPRVLSRDEALELTDAEIEFLAMQSRELWRLGIGPIEDVIRAVEGAGIITTRESLGYLKMDGVSRWFESDGRPYMFISADKTSAVRNRFDVAHELGHILMHSGLSSVDEELHHNELERQAHLFASAFLMPAESIAGALNYPTLDTLLALKKKWKVSIGALIMRAKSLDLIDSDYATRLWKNYSSRGWRKGEPLDDVLSAETPFLMPRAVKMLIEQGGFSKAVLMSTTGFMATDLERLCSLPEGFMSSEPAKVIELNAPVWRSSPIDQSSASPGKVVPLRQRAVK
ncbi:helix-turn-helix domain-containing protein [Aquitalea aquatilis]|uniref:helix-turn-helix domain-containing protein n=1 Tax=Aquitalea aquatilis TaxID=1537400 RepID=UPI0010BD9994|nr:XRE family transcriptional regulator [Aquitalea aquatilis]